MENIIKLSNGISVRMKAKLEDYGVQVVCKWFDEKPEYLGPEDMNKYKSGINSLALKTIQAFGDSNERFGIVNVSHI